MKEDKLTFIISNNNGTIDAEIKTSDNNIIDSKNKASITINNLPVVICPGNCLKFF